MARDDDPPSPPGDAARSLAELAKIEHLTRAVLGFAPAANESLIEPQPGWTEMRTDLERMDLERDLVDAERDLAAGKRRAFTRLRAIHSLRAMRSFERGDRDGAHQEWEALLEEDPQDPGPLLTRAIFYECVDDFDAVIEDLDRAARIAPDLPEVYLRRGSCHVRKGDWPRALANYRRLVHLRPKNIDALVWLANCLRFTKDHATAIRVLGRAIKLAPWRADLYEERAACHYQLDHAEEQLRDLECCLERDPGHAPALRARAALWGRRNDEERRLADLTRAIACDPTHARTFHERAEIHEKRGRCDLALGDLSRAIEIEPEDVWHRRARAKICLTTGAVETAIADLDMVIAKDQEDFRRQRRRMWRELDFDGGARRDYGAWVEAEPYWLRGDAHRRRGDRERALADYQSGMEIDPWRHRELSEHAERRPPPEQKEAWLDDLDRLILLDPGDPTWSLLRAGIFVEAGAYEEARADLDRAITIDPRCHEALHRRAGVQAHLRNAAQAIADESQAIAIWPWDSEYHGWRAFYRVLHEGPSEGAEADARRAVELDREGHSGLRMLAYYLEQCDRWAEVVGVFDRIIEVEPRIASSYSDRAAARLRLGNDEATLRAALADLDAAIARKSTPPVVAERDRVAALLAAAAGDRAPPGPRGAPPSPSSRPRRARPRTRPSRSG